MVRNVSLVLTRSTGVRICLLANFFSPLSNGRCRLIKKITKIAQTIGRPLQKYSHQWSDDKECVISFDAIDRGSNLPFGELFFSLGKFQITSEKHLFLIKIKEINKKLKINYWVVLG